MRDMRDMNSVRIQVTLLFIGITMLMIGGAIYYHDMWGQTIVVGSFDHLRHVGTATWVFYGIGGIFYLLGYKFDLVHKFISRRKSPKRK